MSVQLDIIGLRDLILKSLEANIQSYTYAIMHGQVQDDAVVNTIAKVMGYEESKEIVKEVIEKFIRGDDSDSDG